MTTPLKLGDPITIYGTLLVNNTPTNPNTLRLVIIDPLNVPTEYIYGSDEEIEKIGTGSFSFDLMATQRGKWTYQWFSNHSLTAFETGEIEVSNAITLFSGNDSNPSVATPFVDFRIWDSSGSLVDTGLSAQRTGSDGTVSVNLLEGTYRISAFKLGWIFTPSYFDVTSVTTTAAIVGRLMESRWLQWEDLESIVDKATIDRLFNDTNSAFRDMVMVEQVIGQAESMAETNLLRSWTRPQIALLAANDPALRAQAAWLALEFASERKQEFIAADGKGRYWAQYERAMKHFETLSKSQNHSRGEANAGHGSNSGGARRPVLAPNQDPFVFAPGRNGRGPGGF